MKNDVGKSERASFFRFFPVCSYTLRIVALQQLSNDDVVLKRVLKVLYRHQPSLTHCVSSLGSVCPPMLCPCSAIAGVEQNSRTDDFTKAAVAFSARLGNRGMQASWDKDMWYEVPIQADSCILQCIVGVETS